MCRAIDQHAIAQAAGNADQQAFQMFDVGFGQVLILAGDQADPFPEVLPPLFLRLIVLLQPLGYIIGFTDVYLRAQTVFRIRTDQKVDAGA